MPRIKKLRFPQALKAKRHLSRSDPHLSRIIDEVGALKIELDANESIFEALAISIIYQQLHGKAAASIAARFKALFNSKDSFPSPKAVAKTTPAFLKTAGLSESKALAILDLASKTLEGTIPNRKQAELMNDEDLIEAFTTVKGIGPWTAQMLLIFTLGRPDVWPTADYGVKKGFALLYKKKEFPTPTELESFGERWRPFRSAAAWYLWRVTELPRFKEKASRKS